MSERVIGSVLIGLVLIGGLGACQNGRILADDGSPDARGYPSLRSVPFEARPSSSIEERRQIVRTLLDERDQSRRQTAIVRKRSGLSTDPPLASADGDARAEDIVPDQPLDDGDGFRLTPSEADDTGEVYRTDSQFDDGGLDDFIRQLKRDTSPTVPPPPLDETEEPSSDVQGEDDVSALFPPSEALVGLPEEGGRPILLAAFAPASAMGASVERDIMIRLAAAEEEPGVFCSYFGWTVAWSSMCIAEADTEPLGDGDADVGADLEQELRQSPEESGAGRSAGSGASSSGEAGRERAERRLSESDAAEAIEDAGRSALAPVTSSLEKLRDFMDSRRSRGAGTSSSEPAPSYRSRSPSTRTAAVDRPPTPEKRPKRREDLVIEDRDEMFNFARTPLPAFKPTPDEPVILQAKNDDRSERQPRRRFDPPPLPLLRPGDLLSELKDDGVAAFEREAGFSLDDPPFALALSTEAAGDDELDAMAPSTAVVPPAVDRKAAVNALLPTSETADPLQPVTERAAMMITFEPETPGLPIDQWPRLAALLDDAREKDQKIHIIGEASSNHIARRRATDVGAALVQLGATVEILEYDHDAVAGVDQVRLVLRPAAPDRPARTAEPSMIEK